MAHREANDLCEFAPLPEAASARDIKPGEAVCCEVQPGGLFMRISCCARNTLTVAAEFTASSATRMATNTGEPTWIPFMASSFTRGQCDSRRLRQLRQWG